MAKPNLAWVAGARSVRVEAGSWAARCHGPARAGRALVRTHVPGVRPVPAAEARVRQPRKNNHAVRSVLICLVWFAA